MKRPTLSVPSLATASVLLAAAVAISFFALEPGVDAAPPGGLEAFRFDTFGDEQLWTDVLRMHEVIPAAVDPLTALEVGLKVDVDALPPEVIEALSNDDPDDIDLEDPAVTVELLRLGAVVGVIGQVEGGVLTSVGVTCALCHSTVDDSLTEGIGRRLDGWPNRDLDPGRILSLSPFFEGDDALLQVLTSWGPGMYDPRHHAFDGLELMILNEETEPVLIPPIYGLQGVKWETYTGDGPISYWNAYVGISQMGGKGDFADDRLDPPLDISQDPDLVNEKLSALLRYQLSLKAPRPPKRSFSHPAAARGRKVFNASCAGCHPAPTYTDVADGPDPGQPLLHDASETGVDPEYAERSATKQYRATPLRALWQHAPYFHDGSAATLEDVVEHYVTALPLDLSEQEKDDLVEFLKSL
jgi:mono/diheme cytochrome c family protein